MIYIEYIPVEDVTDEEDIRHKELDKQSDKPKDQDIIEYEETHDEKKLRKPRKDYPPFTTIPKLEEDNTYSLSYKFKGSDKRVLTREDIMAIIKDVPEGQTRGNTLRNRALIAFLWITACRASEAIEFRKKDLLRKETQYDRRTKTYFDAPKETYVFRLFTLKNKVQRERRVGVIYDSEQQLIDIFLEWWNSIPDDNARLFPITRQRVWQIFKREYVGYRPHHMRHSKLTYLAAEENFDSVELTQAAGWSSFQPAGTYLHLDYKKSVY